MTHSLLSLNRVSFAYHDNEPLLHDLSLTLGPGECLAIMGASGCGKSTLLALVAGLMRPHSGHCSNLARRTSIMFQDPLLLPWRSALGNVAFALKGEGLKRTERREKAMRALQMVGLDTTDYQKYPGQLSGGMKQRVAMARALVVEPDLLLLDEPFHALDSDRSERLLALIKDIAKDRDMAIIMVTHHHEEATALADRILTLSEGRLIS